MLKKWPISFQICNEFAMKSEKYCNSSTKKGFDSPHLHHTKNAEKSAFFFYFTAISALFQA